MLFRSVSQSRYSTKGGGYAAYFGANINSFSISHNDFYSSRSKIGFYLSRDYDTLSSFVTVIKHGAGSLGQNPYYLSDTVLIPTHSLLDAAGLAINEVSNDISGKIRSSIPDIGASEFELCGNDAGINSLSGLSNPVPSSNIPVRVVLQNNGSSSLTSTTINWLVNGVVQPALS